VVADTLEVVDEVRGEHDRDVTFDSHIGERGEELPPGKGVEGGERFVEQEDARPLRQREAERDLGALATRERMHGAVERNPQRREPLLGTGGVPPAVEMGADPEMLGRRELAIEGDLLGEKAGAREEVLVLRRRSSEHAGLSRRRAAQPNEQPKERRLAGSVRADKCRDAAFRHFDRAVLQTPRRSVALAEPDGFDRGCFAAHATPRSDAVRNSDRSIASMAWSSTPAARAVSTQRSRPRASRICSSGGGPCGRRSTKVPTPCRPSTNPACSSSR
jgi:hypothetical protein